MNFQEAIPPEVKEFEKKNRKYVQVIMESATARREDLEKIGRELSLMPTPKTTINQECSVKLYRYTPVKEHLAPVPMVIVPSLILRYYTMDLMKGHSLIESLVNAGIDTYLVDWGTPGDEHGQLTFDHYIDVFLRRAIRKVRRETGAPKVHLMGQCLGGTLAAIYASLHPEEIDRLTLLTTPVDFADAGLLSLWTNKETFDVDKVVASFGNTVPASFIHACFQYLDLRATVERYKRLFNNVLDDNFLTYYKALDTWSNDKIPFPGQVFRKFIRGLYQENLLAQGKFDVNGRFADMRNITAPVLNIVAQFDHVFPEKSAQRTNQLVQGKVDYHVIPAGHVTLIALFPDRLKTFQLIEDFAAA
jgi:polyhydroxyalkanoate synthase